MTIGEIDQEIKQLQELNIKDILKNHGANESSAQYFKQISLLDRKRVALVFAQRKLK